MPTGLSAILILVFSFKSQKLHPGDFLRPEVILSRSYITKKIVFGQPPLSSSVCHFLKVP